MNDTDSAHWPSSSNYGFWLHLWYLQTFLINNSTVRWTNNYLAWVSIGTIERIVPFRPSSAVMPQSIAYQRQNIGSKTSTEKLQGNGHHLLVHVQRIHYQYNMEQELLTFESTWFVDCCVLRRFSHRSWFSPCLNGRFVLLTLQYSVLCFIDHCLSFPLFSVGHCIVCPSSVCAFW